MSRGKGGQSVVDPYRHLLGDATDSHIARLAGCTRAYVGKVRKSLNIPTPKRRVPDSMMAMRNKYDALIAPFAGKMTDSEAGEKSGTSITSVRNYRRRHGIPEYGYRTYESKADSFIDLLGKMTDKELANQLGCSFCTIYKVRKKLGIKMLVRAKYTKRNEVTNE